MSGCCGCCGSTDFTLVDGFFYCAVCNTQSQVLREFDHEDHGTVAASLLTTKIRQKKRTTAGYEKGKKAIEEEAAEEEEEHRLPALKQEDFPKYIGHAGLRLATFTKLLAQFSATLIRDFGVAECVKLHVLHILQRYLQHYQVAFCDEELDEENPYCPLVKNEEYEAQKKAKEQQVKAQRETQLKRGENIMALLSSADISANLDAQVTDLDTQDIKAVIEQRTKLSRTAISKALKIPMNTEIIMAILYVGCLFSGASWILLSDITRWFREGRFPMTLFHRMALMAGTQESTVYDSRGVSFCPPTPIMPLHEYVRTVLVLSQLTDIPVQPVSYSFKRILARLCYNLNLPFDFMRRLHVIVDISNPNVVFDAKFTHRFGTVDSETLLQKAYNFFGDNISFALEKSTYQLAKDGSYRQYSVIPSIEMKAVAVILFALKLMFGLNGNSEFNMKKGIGALSSSGELFNFGVWMHQLKMRMNVWRGRRLKDVLEKRTSALPNYDMVKKHRLVCEIKNRKGETASQIRGERHVGGRNLYFEGCVPNYHVMDERDYALFSTFEDDFDLKASGSLEKEALLTPLRYQATRNREWYEEACESDFVVAEADLNKVDRYNAEVFFKSFKHQLMEYAAPEVPGGSKTQDSEALCCSDVLRASWRQLFPCSNHYEAYPRPVYCSGLVSPSGFGERLYVPMIYTSAADIIYQCASPYFSDSFDELLEILAVMIGEDLKIVYTFFLMLEMKCLLPKTLKELNGIVENCEKFTTCAQIECLGDTPRITEVQLYRIDEDVPQANFKFTIANFGKVPGFEKQQHSKKRLRRISKSHQTPEKRLRRRVVRKKAHSILKTGAKEAVGSEICDIPETTADKELSTDFERMMLFPRGEGRSPPSEHEEVSFEPRSGGDENMQSVSDDEEIYGNEPALVKRISKGRNVSQSSPQCILKPTRETLKRITNKYTEYFNFEFETAFALAIPKYW